MDRENHVNPFPKSCPKFHYITDLHVSAVLVLMAEVIEVRLGASPGVIKGYSHKRCDGVSITQRLHGRVPDDDGMKDRLVPVRVLVSHRREDFVQMINVRVPDERAKHAIPMILLETVLYVVRVEIEIRLGAGHAEYQRHLDERVADSFHVQARIGIILVHW